MTDFHIRIITDPGPSARGISDIDRRLERLESRADRVGKAFSRAFSTAAIGAGVVGVLRLADGYGNLSNRLRTVTANEQELAGVSAKVLAIANDTRTALTATAELYTRVGTSAKELGISQAQLLGFTESLNQAITLSGASATEANAGLIQLAQGISSGALRGDELRSVLEQVPVVADVIAQHLGVTRGELRALGAEGKISAQVVLDSFAAARKELGERFAKTVPTMGQALTVLKNNAQLAAGGLRNASGAIAELTLLAANSLRAIGQVGAAMDRDLGGAAGRVLEKVRELNNDLGEIFEEQADRAEGLETTTSRIFRKIQGQEKLLEDARRKFARAQLFGEDTSQELRLIELAKKTIAGLVEEQEKLAASSKKVADSERDRNLEPLLAHLNEEQRILKLSNREREVEVQLRKILETKEGAGLDPTAQQALREALARNQALADQANALDEIRQPEEDYRRGLTALQALLAEGTITTQEFAAARRELALSSGVEQQSPDQGLLGGNLEGIRQAAVLGAQLGIALDEVNRGLTEQENLLAMNNAARQVEIEALQIEQNLRAQGITLDATASAALRERIAGIQQETELQELLNSLRSQDETFAANQEILRQGYENGRLTVEQYTAALERLQIAQEKTAKTGVTLEDFQQVAQQGFRGFVRTIGEGEDAMDRFTLGFIENVQQLLAEKAALALIDALTGGGATAGTGIGGFLAGFVSGKAGGGHVDRGEPVIVGEHGRETFIPEGAGRIVPAGETAAMLGGGQGAAPVVNVSSPPATVAVVNVRDPNEIPQAIQSAAGRQAVLNALGSDPRRAREIMSR